MSLPIFYILASCLVFYISLIAIMTFFQERFVYLPDAVLVETPAVRGMPYENISVRTLDGLLIHGWIVKAENAKGCVLFCHGNAGNISHRLESMAIFHSIGYDVCIFDYRGYGESEGKPSEEGTYSDAVAVWKYLTGTREYDPLSICIFGRSLGGSVAAWLAARVEPGSLIVESSFSSLPALAAHLYPFLPVRFLLRLQYNTEQEIGNVACPILIVHSRDDDIVPVSFGRRLYEAAGQSKRYLEIFGSHNDGFYVSGLMYRNGLRDFLDEYMTGFRKKEKPS